MKHFILPIALGLALVSCNRDNDNNSGNEETPILPVKVVETREDGDLEIEYKYNGNKLTEIIHKDTRGSRKSVVGYTGDFITSITTTTTTTTNNNNVNLEIRENTNKYKYENGKLIEALVNGILSNGDKYFQIITYTYNADGIITQKTNQDNKYFSTSIITIANGNIVKEVKNRKIYSHTDTHIYTYDTMNNPFKNVKGMSPLVLGSTNNILEHVIINESDNYRATYRYSYLYKYENDFPTERIMNYNNDSKKFNATFYTYNK